MTQLFEILSWLFSGLGVAVIVAGHVWLWVSVVRGSRRRGPVCGRCGYTVAELESMTCPECGGDFRKFGITGTYRRGIPVWVFLVAWFVLLALPARSILMLVLQSVPRYVTAGYSIDLEPHSAAPRLTLTMLATFPMGAGGMPGFPGVSAQGTTLTLPIISGPGGPPVFGVISSPGWPDHELGTAPFDPDEIATWLETLGSTAPKEDLLADAQEIAALLDAWDTAGTFTTTRFRHVGFGPVGPTASTFPGWIMPAFAAGWLGVYGLGFLIFLRLRRRPADREP